MVVVVVVVVVAWCAPVAGWVGVVVAAVADFPWCFALLECSPVRISTTMRIRTAATAAAGPPRRRGR